MNITTRSQDFEMSSAIDQFVRDAASTTLHRFGEYIIAVDVFMKDANGPSAPSGVTCENPRVFRNDICGTGSVKLTWRR